MRVLVCDDDLEVGPVIASILAVEGWDVRCVASGEECLTAVADDAPDVLVLDQVMPGLTGTEVADSLRRSGFDGPIVLCSAYLGPELTAEIERLDLEPISKIDLDALVRTVRVAGTPGGEVVLSP